MTDVLTKIYLSLVLVKLLRVSGKMIYVPNFTGVSSCEGFENKVIDFDGVAIDTHYDEETEKKGVGISGPIVMKKKLDDMYDVQISVAKETESGDELIFHSQMNLCTCLKNYEDTPWEPMVKQMQLTGCPIEPDTFHIDKMTISLDPFENCMNREACGSYGAKVEISDGMDVIACYLLGISIEEVELKD